MNYFIYLLLWYANSAALIFLLPIEFDDTIKNIVFGCILFLFAVAVLGRRRYERGKITLKKAASWNCAMGVLVSAIFYCLIQFGGFNVTDFELYKNQHFEPQGYERTAYERSDGTQKVRYVISYVAILEDGTEVPYKETRLNEIEAKHIVNHETTSLQDVYRYNGEYIAGTLCMPKKFYEWSNANTLFSIKLIFAINAIFTMIFSIPEKKKKVEDTREILTYPMFYECLKQQASFYLDKVPFVVAEEDNRPENTMLVFFGNQNFGVVEIRYIDGKLKIVKDHQESLINPIVGVSYDFTESGDSFVLQMEKFKREDSRSIRIYNQVDIETKDYRYKQDQKQLVLLMKQYLPNYIETAKGANEDAEKIGKKATYMDVYKDVAAVSEELKEELLEMVKNGERSLAIKKLNDTTHCGLKKAIKMMEVMEG